MSVRYEVATLADMRLVESAWLRSFRTSKTAGMIAMEDWGEVMIPQIRKVISRPGVTTLVARDSEGADGLTDIIGFVCFESEYETPGRKWQAGGWVQTMEPAEVPLVHYIFVKQSFRRFGIARKLMAQAGVKAGDKFNYTCRTPVVSRIPGINRDANWSPLIARYGKNEGKTHEQNEKS